MATENALRAPVRISKVTNRYLVFDVDDVMYLRREHNICAVFVGTIPQNPQQNVFMGLPIELMPEEAQVLVDKKVAYVVDDVGFHPARLSSLDESTRKEYIQKLKNEAKSAQAAAAEMKERSVPDHVKGRKKQAKDSPRKKAAVADGEDSLFGSSPSPAPAPTPEPSAKPQPEDVWKVTPTTSADIVTPPPDLNASSGPPIDVPSSYPLYAHLHDKGYYMMPGLRFGCDYNVYPGDPLRFHSHFQASSFGWDEEIPMIDLVGGGRLGTTVKKGYLIGGEVPPESLESGGDEASQVSGRTEDDGKGPHVRAFCLEWAGM